MSEEQGAIDALVSAMNALAERVPVATPRRREITCRNIPPPIPEPCILCGGPGGRRFTNEVHGTPDMSFGCDGLRMKLPRRSFLTLASGFLVPWERERVYSFFWERPVPSISVRRYSWADIQVSIGDIALLPITEITTL